MSEREKVGTTLNGKKQIQDGSIDEPLLSSELVEKIAMIEVLEKRLATLENSLGDLTNTDFLAVYNQAKNR